MTETNKRPAFFISDHTGITAELAGKALLAQFAGMEFHSVMLPFIDTKEKAQSALETINHAFLKHGLRPVVFSTLAQPETRGVIAGADALVLDLFELLSGPLQAELGVAPAGATGLSHGIGNQIAYQRRIEAVNFTLNHDDGAKTGNLQAAEVVLVGVSRVGKTPTCLYLALQHGVRAANYPLTPEDFEDGRLPPAIAPHRVKLFGLTINPQRLHEIRTERQPGSEYATLENCRHEVLQSERLFREEGIVFIDVTTQSIEEIAATLMHRLGLRRHVR
jgi:[pyruvate, water dikinase]-phosphate phosphotransferase / [pyruvate, water dikinase] kinase